MSRVVVIEKNKDWKIELTKEELQKMLDDAYTQGYIDGKGRYETITYDVKNEIDKLQKKYEPHYGTNEWTEYRGGVYDGLETLKQKLFSNDEINE